MTSRRDRQSSPRQPKSRGSLPRKDGRNSGASKDRELVFLGRPESFSDEELEKFADEVMKELDLE